MDRYPEVTLRSRPMQVVAALVVVICLLGEIALITQSDPAVVLRATPLLALVAVGVCALFWYPRVRIGPAEVELVNVFRTVRVAWPAIEDVDTRWGLALVTAAGRFTAWAAPRPGAAASGRRYREAARRSATGGSGHERRSDDLGTVASTLVLDRWNAYRESGFLGAVEGEGVAVRMHTRITVVLALLVVAAVAAAIAA